MKITIEEDSTKAFVGCELLIFLFSSKEKAEFGILASGSVRWAVSVLLESELLEQLIFLGFCTFPTVS